MSCSLLAPADNSPRLVQNITCQRAQLVSAPTCLNNLLYDGQLVNKKTCNPANMYQVPVVSMSVVPFLVALIFVALISHIGVFSTDGEKVALQATWQHGDNLSLMNCQKIQELQA